MDLKSTYNRIARDWAMQYQGDTWWIKGTEKFVSFLSNGDLLLDVGCGPGEKSKYLFDKGFKVTGIDFSERMLDLAREQVPNGEFFVKDITCPLEFEQKFDAVFAQAVLLHIPKNQIIGVLKNIIDPLKNNGYLYVAVKERKIGTPYEVIVKENNYGYEYERMFSYFTLGELEKYLASFNLEIVYTDASSWGRTNWIQVIAKKL